MAYELNSNQRAMVHAAEAHLGIELTPIQLCLARLQTRDQMTIANKTKIVKEGDLEFTMYYDNVLGLRVDATRGLTFYFSDGHEGAYDRRLNELMPVLQIHRQDLNAKSYAQPVSLFNIYLGYSSMSVRLMSTQLMNNGRAWNNWTHIKEMKRGDTLFVPWKDVHKSATEYLRTNKVQTVGQVAAKRAKEATK